MIVDPPPGQRPPDIPRIVTFLASIIARIFGWRYAGGLPNVPKMVIVAAPHTSNWDGFWYLVMTAIMRARTHVIMKAEINRMPIAGWIFRQFGGIPVDRRKNNNIVDFLIEEYQRRDKLALVIAPEGTRSYTEYWRAGFYWIAHRANVPIAVAYLNYKTKEMGFCGMMKTTGDIHADMAVLAKLYAEYGVPRNPELFGPVRVRSSERSERAEQKAE